MQGRKRKRHAENAAAGGSPEAGRQPHNSTPPDLPEQLLALHPKGAAWAVAFGRMLAVSVPGCVLSDWIVWDLAYRRPYR